MFESTLGMSSSKGKKPRDYGRRVRIFPASSSMGVYIQVNPCYDAFWRSVATSLFAHLAGINLGFGSMSYTGSSSSDVLSEFSTPSHIVQVVLARHLRRIVGWIRDPESSPTRKRLAKSRTELLTRLAQGDAEIGYKPNHLVEALVEWYGRSVALSVTNGKINPEDENCLINQFSAMVQTKVPSQKVVPMEPSSRAQESNILDALGKAFGVHFVILNPHNFSRHIVFRPNRTWCDYQSRRRFSLRGQELSIEDKLAMLPLPADRPAGTRDEDEDDDEEEEDGGGGHAQSKDDVKHRDAKHEYPNDLLVYLPLIAVTDTVDQQKRVASGEAVCVVRFPRHIRNQSKANYWSKQRLDSGSINRFDGSASFASWMHVDSSAYDRQMHTLAMTSMLQAIANFNPSVDAAYLCDCLDLGFPSDPEDERDLVVGRFMSSKDANGGQGKDQAPARKAIRGDEADCETDGETDYCEDTERERVSKKVTLAPTPTPTPAPAPAPAPQASTPLTRPVSRDRTSLLRPTFKSVAFPLTVPPLFLSRTPKLNGVILSSVEDDVVSFFKRYAIYYNNKYSWLGSRRDQRVLAFITPSRDATDKDSLVISAPSNSQAHLRFEQKVLRENRSTDRGVQDMLGKPFFVIQFDSSHLLTLAICTAPEMVTARKQLLTAMNRCVVESKTLGSTLIEDINVVRRACEENAIPADSSLRASILFNFDTWGERGVGDQVISALNAMLDFKGVWVRDVGTPTSLPVVCKRTKFNLNQKGRVAQNECDGRPDERVQIRELYIGTKETKYTQTGKQATLVRRRRVNEKTGPGPFDANIHQVDIPCANPMPLVGMVLTEVQMNTIFCAGSATLVETVKQLVPISVREYAQSLRK